MAEQKVLIGVLREREEVVPVLEDLVRVGLRDDQLGFTLRHEQGHQGAEALRRGVIGGVLGAVDLVLLPVVGPVDASMMLETALPATEEVIDRFGIAARRAKAEKQESAPQPAQVKEQEAAGKGQQGTGAVTGGVLGGLLGAAAAFLIPGIGPVIAGGVLVGLLSGAAMGGVAGGFLGAFVEMGVPEEQARYFEREFRAGRAILTIKIENRRQELLVRNIVRRHGAEHVEVH